MLRLILCFLILIIYYGSCCVGWLLMLLYFSFIFIFILCYGYLFVWVGYEIKIFELLNGI